ncbi:5-carboxymethyl-2-hydroxymuconate delta isomerase [Streptomyces tendae]|uniref:5-carboxymethyl-2-hydroxymuconate delta isomerase n=1 Tax=Streptomyces tendae TaxID=1932 RepID=UPI0024906D8C|nr:5-carboxymethyl-2-hydroxymuconate delta isomerase [Streptomyces tendae]
MPHVHITLSPRITDVLDHSDLVTALNALVVDRSGSSGVSKTSMSPVETYGGGMVMHVEVALLHGRSPAVKAHLSEGVLELIATHLSKAGMEAVDLSVVVRDLPDSYRLSRGRSRAGTAQT